MGTVTEEPIEIKVARLEERYLAQGRILAEIKGGIKRIEEKLEDPPPCRENTRRLETLEKTVFEDHETRIQTEEKAWSNLNGRLAVWGILVILGCNVITGVTIAYMAGLIGG